ncbi:MAG: hypothetical protein DMD61_06715 [Gemmatimonadetes bacterium]|nr:MAG: hypothetical protein DMD61_06715 [Gemmatimonadota bacterium]
MNTLSHDLQLDLVREASRAPSAHNTQPARWRFSPDSAVVLFEEVSRRLPVADPTGRDHRVGLGAAFEGLRLALSRHGFDLSDPKPPDDSERVTAPPGLSCIARSVLRSGAEPDPLAAQVTRRRTYRGRFFPADVAALDALHEVLDPAPDVTPVYDAASIAVLAAESDRASFGFLALRGYQGELYRWLRFSPRDGGWTRDGLTADCLELSRVERLVGRWLFVPAYFALLAQVGLHRPLVAEAGRTRTAAALAIFHRPQTEDRLLTGRRFYRFWLELTAAGFAARPMSVLADDPFSVALLRERWAVPASAAIINVFVVGVAPVSTCRSPRLPPEELLV